MNIDILTDSPEHQAHFRSLHADTTNPSIRGSIPRDLKNGDNAKIAIKRFMKLRQEYQILDAHLKNEYDMYRVNHTLLPMAYAPCIKTVGEMEKVSMNELKIGVQNRGKLCAYTQ